MYMDMTKLMDSEDRKYYVKNTIFKRNKGFKVIYTWPKYGTFSIDSAVIYLTEKEVAFRDEFRDETKLVIPLSSITAIKRIVRPHVWGGAMTPLQLLFERSSSFKKTLQKPLVIVYKDKDNIEKNVLIFVYLSSPDITGRRKKMEELYKFLKKKIQRTTKVIEEK